MQLSQRLRTTRKAKGVSLKTASRAMGCAFQHLSRLETDLSFRPRMALLENMCAYYGISQDVLIPEAGRIPRDCYLKLVHNPHLLTAVRALKV